MSDPKIFVIAGPNGAGKSTCAATILPKRFPTERFLNADDIARALATDSAIEAGRVMIRRMRELRKHRETFAFETTFAGKTHVRFLSEAQDAGYLVHMVYVWLSNAELAQKRVSSARSTRRPRRPSCGHRPPLLARAQEPLPALFAAGESVGVVR